MNRCPRCGQIVRTENRLGIAMGAQQVRIFDAIKRGGVEGVPVATICELIGVPFNNGSRYVRSMVQGMNHKLEEVGYRIVSINHAWHLMRFHVDKD